MKGLSIHNLSLTVLVSEMVKSLYHRKAVYFGELCNAKLFEIIISLYF